MPRLLLVAYYFPPDGGGGTQRCAKFSRYLCTLGWEVTVLTRTPPPRRGDWDPEDQSLLQELESIRIVRVCEPAGRGVNRQRSASHQMQGWIDSALATARQIVGRGEVDVVLLSMPPFSLGNLGKRLAAETGIPIVYDLRDPWALGGWQQYRTWWHWRREFSAMRDTLESADGIVANTPEAAKDLQRNITGIEPRRLTVIPNGYDAADFEAVDKVPSSQGSDNGEESFLLVWTGTVHAQVLYPERSFKATLKRSLSYSPVPWDATGRTPVHLLSAIRRLRESGSQAGTRLRVVLVGQADDASRRCVAQSGVADAVEFPGYVTHAESVAWLMRADGLFLPFYGATDAVRSLFVPGKTYEYLASGKPILGCLPEGDARDLVERSERGYLAYPTDATEVASALARLIDDWRLKRLPGDAPSPWVSGFERRSLTRRLARFLEQIIGFQEECRVPNVVLEPTHS